MQPEILLLLERLVVAVENISHDIENLPTLLNEINRNLLYIASGRRGREMTTLPLIRSIKRQKSGDIPVSISSTSSHKQLALCPGGEKESFVSRVDESYYPHVSIISEDDAKVLNTPCSTPVELLNDTTAVHKTLLADISTLPKQDKSVAISDSIEDATCADEGEEHSDSSDWLGETCEGTSFPVKEAERGEDVESRLDENERGEGYFEDREERAQGKATRRRSEKQMFPSPQISLEERERRKYKKGPFRCETCQKSFPFFSFLENHRRVHTGERPFKCTICQKTFAVKSSLVIHLRVHSGERPYMCTVCGKVCSTSSNMTKHMRIHSEEKPFECELCRKRFREKCDLTRHTRIHTGERPFLCADCGKQFSMPQHLSRHRRFVHKIKP